VRSLVVGASTVTFLDIEDLVSCGVEGMIEAYHAFDPARGVRFSTYALPRIRGSILDALRSAHPLPRSLQELAAANDNATARLYSELGRTPTTAEVAAHLGLPVEKFLSSLRASSISVLSLEKLTNRDDETAATLAELADDDPGVDPEQVVAESTLRRYVVVAIRRLPERERRIICDYYLRGCSLQSIAKAMAISEGRASQIRDRAVRRIREEIA
jgi:RNA polymerase sigma factor for flagellar operon FliA